MRVRDLQTRVQVCLEKGVVPAPDTRNTLHKALAAHVQKEVQQHVHSLIISTSLFQPSELPPPSPVHTHDARTFSAKPCSKCCNKKPHAPPCPTAIGREATAVRGPGATVSGHSSALRQWYAATCLGV